MATIRPASTLPLSVLPLTTLLRNLVINSVTSSPVLLPPSLTALKVLANSTSPFLNADSNHLLRWGLKKTLYAQFCAGENGREVTRTINGLKELGYTGVILGYAKEAVLSQDQVSLRGESRSGSAKEVKAWRKGTMETVALAQKGDFVALKFTGAGQQAFFHLVDRKPPPGPLASAMDDICTLAGSRGVRLLLDAEQAAVQKGIDDWALHYMRKYNSESSQAVVYNTYQAYLKQTPATLSSHLAAARDDNFCLGIKLVRGAYLGSDPRHHIHDTKADTDAAYNAVAESVLRRQWADTIVGSGAFPDASIVVASHNAESVSKARKIVEEGGAEAEVAFAQLQGMADEVSCTLIGRGTEGRDVKSYKYLVWGTTGECVKYLLRRAQENRDAVARTRAGRDAMWAEVVRRMKRSIGLA